MWEFGWSEIIATGALVVAIAGWIDSRLRVSRTEVSFALEETNEENRFLIRATGTRTVKDFRLDLTGLARYEIDGLTFRNIMRPGDSITFWMNASHGLVPEELVVKFGRRGERVIAFPQSVELRPAIQELRSELPPAI
ncbi:MULTISPECIES: hypothetical protein [Bacteria]|uniref:hypothetical protein n=1 Tax=Bacteria TaxID=2 RepID=UPI003C7BD2F1